MHIDTQEAFSHLPEGWRHAIQVYLKSIHNISGSQRSVRIYKSTLERFFKNVSDPGACTKSDVLEFMQLPSAGKRRAGEETFGTTKNSKRSILKSFYEFCQDFHYNGEILFPKPLPTLGLKPVKRGTAHYTLTTVELEKFFAAINAGTDKIKRSRDFSLYSTYLFTTRRRSELAALRWGDISRTEIVDKDGRARTGYTFRFHMKGKGATISTQELPQPCYDAILEYLTVSGRIDTIQAGDPVWCSIHLNQGRIAGNDKDKEVPLNSDYIAREMSRYCAQCGFAPEASHLHILRHSAARIRYSSGQDIISLKETLGHQRLDTTMHYIGAMSGVSDPMAALLEQGAFKFLSRR